MQNECIPLFRGGQPDLTAQASAPIVGGTFVALSATIQSGPTLNTSTDGGNFVVTTATAAGDTFGVAGYDAPTGTKLAVLRPGNTVPMIADGAITFGQSVEVGTAGKPRVLASGIKRGRATNTVASGGVVYIEILG